MKYSIIIPALNEELLLPGLLEQLNDNGLKEKYGYEVVVSDGNSRDNTITISKKLANKTIEYESGELRTISFGRHKGVLNSSGNILIFINADVRFSDVKTFFDVLENEFLISSYKAMTCKVKIFPEEERLIDRLFSLFLNNYIYILNLIGIGMARGECQVMFRDLYEEIGGYQVELSAGEDFELSTRIRKKGKILFARNITIYESPRRYHAWGYFRTMYSWFVNSTSSWILKKSLFKKWDPVR